MERLVLVHPQRVKAIASAKLKNDRVDSETLAHLLRCDLLPESWKSDRETQRRRQQVRMRAGLVRQQTRLKNQVHAVLHQQGLHSPVTDLFGRNGRLWLAQVKLPESARQAVEACLRMLDRYADEIQRQNLQLREKAQADERVQWHDDDPGDGRNFGHDGAGRDRRHRPLCRQARLVQLCRAGAARAGRF